MHNCTGTPIGYLEASDQWGGELDPSDRREEIPLREDLLRLHAVTLVSNRFFSSLPYSGRRVV
jgi:hypothetical protein